MTVPQVDAEAEASILRLADRYSTDSSVRILILGSFDPQSKLLLKALRRRLRKSFGFTAYLEEEFNLHVGLQDTCLALARASTFIAFVITHAGSNRGWQVELTDLVRPESRCMGKVGVYYEKRRRLPRPVQDILFDNPIRQGEIVDSADFAATVNALEQRINTFLARMGRP